MWETQQQTLQHTHKALALGCDPRTHWWEANAVTTTPPSLVLPLLWIYSRNWSLSSSPKSLVFCQSQHCGSSSKWMAHNCNFTQVQPSLKWKKKCYNSRVIFSVHWLVKKRTMADEGADHGTDNDDDTICDFSRYSCNLTRKRPQILCIETTRSPCHLNELSTFLQHFYGLNGLKNCCPHFFFFSYWVRDLVWNKVRLRSSQWPSLGQRKVPMVGWLPLQRWRHKSNIINSCEDRGQTKRNWIHRKIYL